MTDIGHNRYSFDDVVAENLERGIYWAQRDALIRVIRDPTMTTRHEIVLAEIIAMTNASTGTCFPGRKWLAQATGYTEDTIATTIKELVARGYIVSDKRAPPSGGRPLAHYAIVKPTADELRAAVDAHVAAIRAKGARPRKPSPRWPHVKSVLHGNSAEMKPIIHVDGSEQPADVNHVVHVNSADRTSEVNTVLHVNRPDVNTALPTVIDPPLPPPKINAGRGEGEERGAERETVFPREAGAVKSDALVAIEEYNACARKHGWEEAHSLTPLRLSEVESRLKDIGGLEPFRHALTEIPRNDFLSGRKPPLKDGKRFRLNLKKLLSTSSGMGDVLAELIDSALSRSQVLEGPNGKPWGWWRAEIDNLRTLPPHHWRKYLDEVKPNGTWPWWLFGPPPGDAECYVHPDVILERRLDEKFGSKENREKAIAKRYRRMSIEAGDDFRAGDPDQP